MRIIAKESGDNSAKMSKMQNLEKLDELEMIVFILKGFANYSDTNSVLSSISNLLLEARPILVLYTQNFLVLAAFHSVSRLTLTLKFICMAVLCSRYQYRQLVLNPFPFLKPSKSSTLRNTVTGTPYQSILVFGC